MNPEAETVAEILSRLENCTRFGARFVSASEQAEFYTYSEVLRRARASAAFLQSRGLKPGDHVAVILPTGIEFFDAFLGIQLAGAVPTALYPPFRLGKLDEYFTRLRRMLTRIGARFLITEKRIKRIIGEGVVDVPSLQTVIEAGDLCSETAQPASVSVNPDSAAFFQFSSGSTSDPKAVVVSHRNLVCNLAMMKQALVYRDESEIENGAVCWLPLYHDMGLVGCLYLKVCYPADHQSAPRPRLLPAGLSIRGCEPFHATKRPYRRRPILPMRTARTRSATMNWMAWIFRAGAPP